jgi:hypothetical protein
MVGDPKTEEGKKLIHDASPLFKAEQIKKPLLIIQGANDPRVKKAEADQIVIALRERGHDVSYLLAEDEGHGFAKPVNRMAMYAEVERFLADKLGGRYQADMPDDVAQRLNELRVQIETVTYTSASSLKAAVTLPELNYQFVESTENWDVKLEVQGQSVPMQLKRSYRRDGDFITITDETKGAIGNSTDSVKYTSKLEPVSRKLSLGPQAIEAVYQPGTIKVSSDGNESELIYDGALLCDGPGQEAILASMPLAEGTEFVAFLPKLMNGKIALARIKAEGVEEVNGVSCLKVSVSDIENPAEKLTIWIDSKTKSPVRSEQVLPEFGNAVLTKSIKRPE